VSEPAREPRRRSFCDDVALVRDAAGQPVARTREGWVGVPTALLEIPAQAESGPKYAEAPTVLIATSGRGRRWYRRAGSERMLSTCPTMIELYGAGYEIDRARWEGQAGECIALRFPSTMVTALLHEEASDLHIETRHEVFDEQLVTLGTELLREARRGASTGALYVEGLSIAILGFLRERHGTARARPPTAAAPRLSERQRAKLIDFVTAHLGEDLSVSRLAEQAALSPFHFARAFKASFELSPHRYVQQQRIDRATRLLRSAADRSIADIAFELGFSSQAHFTEVFRRHTGTTPGRLREH
jgi:AraC family transcriptional regulator